MRFAVHACVRWPSDTGKALLLRAPPQPACVIKAFQSGLNLMTTVLRAAESCLAMLPCPCLVECR